MYLQSISKKKTDIIEHNKGRKLLRFHHDSSMRWGDIKFFID